MGLIMVSGAVSVARVSPCITVVTLGVLDLNRARRFYTEGLGFNPSPASDENIVFLRAGGIVLGLYPRDLLAEDAQLPLGRPSGGSAAAVPGFGGITLACNVATKPEVDALLARAERAGARVLKSAREVFWGGYSGYFADLDGHPWEVAYNPHWGIDEAGQVVLP